MEKCSQINYALDQKLRIGDSPTNFGFKIVSSQMVELWTPNANYGLVFESRVVLEGELDPIILAKIFGIPSSSGETIDLLIQMFEFPLTVGEAIIFAALSAFSNKHSDVSRELLLKKWRQMTNQRKMEIGFRLLSPVIGHSAGDLKAKPHYNQLHNEFHEVIGNRERIHKEFSKMLGDEIMSGVSRNS